MKAAGIPTAVYYPNAFMNSRSLPNCGCKWGDFPASEKASREVLSLPMHPFLSEADQDKVIDALNQALVKPAQREEVLA